MNAHKIHSTKNTVQTDNDREGVYKLETASNLLATWELWMCVVASNFASNLTQITRNWMLAT